MSNAEEPKEETNDTHSRITKREAGITTETRCSASRFARVAPYSPGRRPLEFTQEAADREVAIHSLNHESVLARRLRAAIRRIDEGSYGVCTSCEGNIAANRLKAIPWAELCILCQETADRFECAQGHGSFDEAVAA